MVRHPRLVPCTAIVVALVMPTALAIEWADLFVAPALWLDYDDDAEFVPLRHNRQGRHGRRRARGDDDDRPGPLIPEPMVFDLVRPLNARAGEFEANVLAVVPLRRGPAGVAGLPDPLGTVPFGPQRAVPEWAPEFEWCPRDGVTWEVEFPFRRDTFEAIKVAHQQMLGIGFDDRFIHGWHAIGLNDFDSGATTIAVLWVAGFRFDRTWSTLAFIGGRQEIGPPGYRGTEYLQNVSLFADVSDEMVFGVESNCQQDVAGPAALLLMPQFHWQLTRVLTIQAGAGYRFATGGSIPEAAVRVILAN